DVVPEIERAEAAGFTTAWASGRYDALIQLALAGPRTKRIELGTGIVTTWQRHPMALAAQALTVQSASDGRFTLGIGVGHRFMIEGSLGFEWKPIRHMREYLSVLRQMMAGETVTYQGEEFHITSYKHSAAGLAAAPPIIVAALAPQMLRMTGRLADGTIVFLGGTRYLREVAVPTITRAAHEAGRPAPRVIAGVPVWVTDRDPAALREKIAPKLANYDQRPAYRAVLDANGSARSADVVMIGNEKDVSARLAE
ncbi:MAG: TIGR03564 family F420-dependent LLM class oxidoreductase, partial [Candidatus Limnocylindria bacterium]